MPPSGGARINYLRSFAESLRNHVCPSLNCASPYSGPGWARPFRPGARARCETRHRAGQAHPTRLLQGHGHAEGFFRRGPGDEGEDAHQVE